MNQTCRRCAKQGYAEDEFLNYWTGLCAECHNKEYISVAVPFAPDEYIPVDDASNRDSINSRLEKQGYDAKAVSWLNESVGSFFPMPPDEGRCKMHDYPIHHGICLVCDVEKREEETDELRKQIAWHTSKNPAWIGENAEATKRRCRPDPREMAVRYDDDFGFVVIPLTTTIPMGDTCGFCSFRCDIAEAHVKCPEGYQINPHIFFDYMAHYFYVFANKKKPIQDVVLKAKKITKESKTLHEDMIAGFNTEMDRSILEGAYRIKYPKQVTVERMQEVWGTGNPVTIPLVERTGEHTNDIFGGRCSACDLPGCVGETFRRACDEMNYLREKARQQNRTDIPSDSAIPFFNENSIAWAKDFASTLGIQLLWIDKLDKPETDTETDQPLIVETK